MVSRDWLMDCKGLAQRRKVAKFYFLGTLRETILVIYTVRQFFWQTPEHVLPISLDNFV
jgi:hypothetical protein